MKFEEHEGKLFHMLEEPVPLKEKDTNVLVQFITHGIIGEYVMEHWLDCNQENVPIYIDDVDSDGDVTVWIDENRNEHHCCPFPMFEIIGYPVEEGSRWWALYQMMQGEKVRHKIAIGNVCWAINQDGDVQYYDMDDLAYIGTIRSKLEFGKRHAVKTGWQIYKEPEPQYKVGDWVDCNGNQCLIEVIGRDLGRGNYYHFSHGFGGAYANSIIRKLSPSEIIVKIGCLKGRVEDLSYAENGRFWLIGKATERCPVGMYAILYDEMLDTKTREIVESLLGAMQEEK